MQSWEPATDAERADPAQMWRDQLAGRRRYDPCEFARFFYWLFGQTQWEHLFADLPKSEPFIERLRTFFDLHRGALDAGESRTYGYFAPMSCNARSRDELTELLERHLDELRRLAHEVGESDLVSRLQHVRIEWVGVGRDLMPLKRDHDQLFTEVHEVVHDLIDARRNWSNAHYALQEAGYMLAADYGLAKYLMEDFYDIRFDFQPYFNIWVGGGDYASNGDRCLLTRRIGR